jgi:hypothetical protein
VTFSDQQEARLQALQSRDDEIQRLRDAILTIKLMALHPFFDSAKIAEYAHGVLNEK